MSALEVGPYGGPQGEWDNFVRGAGGWTAYHLFAWKPLLTDVLGHECPYLAARDGAGRVRGVLPLVRVRSLLFGHYLVSMPFLNYGGPLGDPDAVAALCQRAAEEAAAGGVGLLELRSRHRLPTELGVSHRKLTVVLDLPHDGGADSLWERFSPKLRSQIRRPQKEGMTVRFGPDQVAGFYRVFARHMRDLGTPVLARRLFESLPTTFDDDVWFGVVYLGEEPVAAGCGFRWGGEFELAWASSLRQHARSAPNMLLYWSFMQRCITHRITTFNFGRCSPDSGTHRFKRQWADARDELLWWYQWAAGDLASTPSPDAGRYALGPRLWRHLPVSMANVLGPRIVRFIP